MICLELFEQYQVAILLELLLVFPYLKCQKATKSTVWIREKTLVDMITEIQVVDANLRRKIERKCPHFCKNIILRRNLFDVSMKLCPYYDFSKPFWKKKKEAEFFWAGKYIYWTHEDTTQVGPEQVIFCVSRCSKSTRSVCS